MHHCLKFISGLRSCHVCRKTWKPEFGQQIYLSLKTLMIQMQLLIASHWQLTDVKRQNQKLAIYQKIYAASYLCLCYEKIKSLLKQCSKSVKEERVEEKNLNYPLSKLISDDLRMLL